jgi:hypothetical protein
LDILVHIQFPAVKIANDIMPKAKAIEPAIKDHAVKATRPGPIASGVRMLRIRPKPVAVRKIIEKIKPEKEKIIAEALARLVMIQTSGNGRLWRIGWEQFDEPVLQKYVAEVSIYLIGDTGRSCWGNSAAFWLWEAEKRVQVILNEKEPKVSTYRKFCNKVWLLIVADKSWLSSNLFPNQDFANAVFHSSFDRAFLLDESSAAVYKFKIEHKRSANRA